MKIKKIELKEDIDTSSFSYVDLIVIKKNGKKFEYQLSEIWADKFKRLMQVGGEEGTFGQAGTQFAHHYLGYRNWIPKNSKEQETELLFYEFRKKQLLKRMTLVAIFILFFGIVLYFYL